MQLIPIFGYLPCNAYRSALEKHVYHPQEIDVP